MDETIVYTREQAIEIHVSCTTRIACYLAYTAERNKLNASLMAEFDRAVVEMVFNPQTDVDRSRVMQIVVDEYNCIWTEHDNDNRIGMTQAFYLSARARRFVANHGTPLYLRMRGRANEIAKAWQIAHGEQPLGIRDVWYQFDWYDVATVEEATRFAINYEKK